MKKVTRRAAVVVALPIAALGLLVGGAGGASASGASGPHDYWHGYDYWYDYDYTYKLWYSDDDCKVGFGHHNVFIGSIC